MVLCGIVYVVVLCMSLVCVCRCVVYVVVSCMSLCCVCRCVVCDVLVIKTDIVQQCQVTGPRLRRISALAASTYVATFPLCTNWFLELWWRHGCFGFILNFCIYTGVEIS